jgi:CHAD domain-containing protein
MTVRLPSDLLICPADEASRVLALSYLRQIEQSRTRLEQPEDVEALHDFRVGIRRLRSCIRAYRPQLKGSLNKKAEQRLRKLMRATNVGRDTEVQLTWLRHQGERLQPEDTQGLFWLIGRLEGRKHEALDPITAKVGGQFSKMAVKLRRRLSTLEVEIEAGPGRRDPTFGQVTGQAIDQHVAGLEKNLKQLVGAENVKQAHRTRVAVKRLRYLLEPVGRRNPRTRDLVARLKEAQDRLGELHDMHVLSDEIASALDTLARSYPGHQSERGLRTLQQITRNQAAATFERFNSTWGSDRAVRILARVNEIARSLKEESTTVTNGVRSLTLRGTSGPEPVPSVAHVNHEHAV